MTIETPLTDEDTAYVARRINELKAEERGRFERVMAEIDKDEQEALMRLKQIRLRRAVVLGTGHHG